MKLFEILRNLVRPVRWVQDKPGTFGAEFSIDDEEFYIQVTVVQASKKFANVLLGKFDENGRGSTVASSSKKPMMVFSTVVTNTKRLLSSLSVDVVVFSAKQKDGKFDKRISLYTALSNRLTLETGWNLHSRFKGETGIYILSKEHLDKEDFDYLRKALNIKKK